MTDEEKASMLIGWYAWFWLDNQHNLPKEKNHKVGQRVLPPYQD
jgi:hypothetical protein